MAVIKIDRNRIRNYRVWFHAYTFSLGFFAPGEFPGHPVLIEGVTNEGVQMEAYTAADAVEQAKLEIPHLIRNHPGGPFNVVIWKVRPEGKPESIAPDCPHLRPCIGQCEGFPIESDSHG